LEVYTAEDSRDAYFFNHGEKDWAKGI